MADDGDLPWLSYHFLVCEHDIPNRDFLRSCMEEVEHIFVRLCPSVTKRVDEYLESVIKLAVFTWTCSLFSVNVISTSDLAHLYNVTTQDIQSVSEAIEVGRDVVRGAIAVKLIPRIVAYSVENPPPAAQAPPTEVPAVAKDKSPNGSKEKVPGRRRSKTAGVDLAMARERAWKTRERLSQKSRHQQKDKHSRRASKNKTSPHSVAIGALTGSCIANTSTQSDTRTGVDSLATIRSCAPTPPAHPALAVPSSDRSALPAVGQPSPRPTPPPNPPTDVTADAHAAPLSRPGTVPRAAGIRQHAAQNGVPPLSPSIARAIPAVPSSWAVRVPMTEPEPRGGAAAERAPPPPHSGDLRQEYASEGAALVLRRSPPLLGPVADRLEEDCAAIRANDSSTSAMQSSPEVVMSDSAVIHPPAAASSCVPAPFLARDDASQRPGVPLHHDIPADPPRIDIDDASGSRDIRSASPSRSRSASEEARVEQELAAADDGTLLASPLPSPPRSPRISPLDHAREPSLGVEQSLVSHPVSANRRLALDADFRVMPASPHKSVPSLPGALQQTCPPMVPFVPSVPTTEALPTPPPATEFAPTSKAFPNPTPAADLAPGNTATVPPSDTHRVQTLLHHIDAIRDVELRLRVWALENALRFLHNFNGVFPPECGFADHAGARDGAVEGWAHRMRAALVADVRRAERAVLLHLHARDAVAAGVLRGWVVAPAAEGV